jgi:hypothetical protein
VNGGSDANLLDFSTIAGFVYWLIIRQNIVVRRELHDKFLADYAVHISALLLTLLASADIFVKNSRSNDLE